MISQTAELRDFLSPSNIAVEMENTTRRGKHYMALGCDLTDIDRLSEVLEKETDLENSLVLCIAEVSVTYMDVATADSLIRWASRYNDSMLVLATTLT